MIERGKGAVLAAMIDWDSFTWEAFATLATGLAAVSAAWFVARRQAQIIERQVVLQELAFRSDVFDRRAQVYKAIRHYVGDIVYSGKYEHTSLDLYSAYLDALETSRFLFSNKLYLELKAMQSFIDGFLSYAEYAAERAHFRKVADWENAKAEVDRRAIELRRRFQALPAMFEPEISLKVPQSSIDGYVTSMEDDVEPDEVGARPKNEEC